QDYCAQEGQQEVQRKDLSDLERYLRQSRQR
nr:RecName: Full=2S seed storage-like protein; AltName: Full=2S albumin storage-like protein; Short=Rc-2S-Alb [Ricinus communis]